MKSKVLMALAAVAMGANSYAASKGGLDSEQASTLTTIVINIVTFLLGLFINPKKRNNP